MYEHSRFPVCARGVRQDGEPIRGGPGRQQAFNRGLTGEQSAWIVPMVVYLALRGSSRRWSCQPSTMGGHRTGTSDIPSDRILQKRSAYRLRLVSQNSDMFPLA